MTLKNLLTKNIIKTASAKLADDLEKETFNDNITTDSTKIN
jgi:hypothetical protein